MAYMTKATAINVPSGKNLLRKRIFLHVEKSRDPLLTKEERRYERAIARELTQQWKTQGAQEGIEERWVTSLDTDAEDIIGPEYAGRIEELGAENLGDLSLFSLRDFESCSGVGGAIAAKIWASVQRGLDSVRQWPGEGECVDKLV